MEKGEGKMKIARSEWNGGIKDVSIQQSVSRKYYLVKKGTCFTGLFDVADCQWLHQHNGDVKMYYFILNHAFFPSIFQFGGWNIQGKILFWILFH